MIFPIVPSSRAVSWSLVMIDFRWVAGIAIWTMLAGPMFAHLRVSSQPPRPRPATTATSSQHVIQR